MADTSILKSADIQSAIGIVDEYVNTCNGIFERLQTTINNLTAPDANFNGDSAEGYNDFFRQITPALTDNLTTPGTSLTSSLKDMLEGIKQTLLDSVDPELGNANRSSGGQT